MHPAFEACAKEHDPEQDQGKGTDEGNYAYDVDISVDDGGHRKYVAVVVCGVSAKYEGAGADGECATPPLVFRRSSHLIKYYVDFAGYLTGTTGTYLPLCGIVNYRCTRIW